MKTITPFQNTPTIVHVNELPPINGGFLTFGFNPGKFGDSPFIKVEKLHAAENERNFYRKYAANNFDSATNK